jgi:hypothetical protein
LDLQSVLDSRRVFLAPVRFLPQIFFHMICDIGNAFLYGKTKEKVYITAGPEFGVNLHGKNLFIDKSLYGLKTSADRFYEHLSESLLRLGFKKT